MVAAVAAMAAVAAVVVVAAVAAVAAVIVGFALTVRKTTHNATIYYKKMKSATTKKEKKSWL